MNLITSGELKNRERLNALKREKSKQKMSSINWTILTEISFIEKLNNYDYKSKRNDSEERSNSFWHSPCYRQA